MDISDPYWPWHDRKGNKISAEKAVQLLGATVGLRRVGDTQLGPLRVSTVHLVVGHPCHGGAGCQAIAMGES